MVSLGGGFKRKDKENEFGFGRNEFKDVYGQPSSRCLKHVRLKVSREVEAG